MGETLSIETSRFGRIEVDDKAVLHFSGLPGFANATRFAVMDHSETESFSWLVSLDDPKLAFVIANPWHFFPGYDPAIATRHLKGLDISNSDHLEIVVFASFYGSKVSLNLSAPIVINRDARRAAQVILDDPRYSTREEIPALDPKAQPQAAETEQLQEAIE
ncbi:MAG: flagellar assembly protein FliW [Myxococcales bacterium]|nr:flagellar assembly protein FliW [Myxococcales bacterium]